MAEHQIARAYAERLTRAAEWQAAFDELRDWSAESLEGRGGRGTAWLIIVERPARPVPRAAPRLGRETAKAIVNSACRHPVTTHQPTVLVLRVLEGELSYITVGLNAWVITNRVREGAPSRRESYIELNHDGSLVFAVNLPQFTLPSGEDPPPEVAIVNPYVVEQACADLEALVLQVLRTRRIDSPMRVQASVASEGQLPLTYVTREGVTTTDSRCSPACGRSRPRSRRARPRRRHSPPQLNWLRASLTSSAAPVGWRGTPSRRACKTAGRA